MGVRLRGFTLIELLVVIAVIAILAGMMFPVIIRAKDSARQAQCLSNLRQLANGISLYEADFDDMFPFAIDYWDRNTQEIWRSWDYYIPNASKNVALLSNRAANDGSPYGGQIDRVLRPYTVSDEIWRCPGDTGVGGISAATSTTYTQSMPNTPVWQITRGTGTWGGTSYVYRTELGLHFKAVSRIRFPSQTQVFMDATYYWHNRLHRRPRSDTSEWTDYNQGSYDMLYTDSHVRNVSQKDYEDAWMAPYKNRFGQLVWTPFD